MTGIRIGNFFNNLSEYLDSGNTVIITDENVNSIYGKRFPDVPRIVLKPGENNKTPETVLDVYEHLLKHGADRKTFIAGIGGGVVCDIAGFAASTYMRGLRFGFFPTTLLAQADAAIGGKNGVNYKGLKNHIGTIVQPEFVLVDPSVLRTLEKKEIGNGLVEIIKHGLIGDPELFDYAEKNVQQILSLEEGPLLYVLEKSGYVKMKIVSADEKEAGERRHLNFGHTFGHIFEELLPVSHGEAVATGMRWAVAFSSSEGMIGENDAERILDLIKKFEFPADLRCDPEDIKSLLFHDKKRESGSIRFVFLERVGRSVIKRIRIKQMEGFIDDMCQSW